MIRELTALTFAGQTTHAPDLIRGLGNHANQEVPGQARGGRHT